MVSAQKHRKKGDGHKWKKCARVPGNPIALANSNLSPGKKRGAFVSKVSLIPFKKLIKTWADDKLVDDVCPEVLTMATS